MLALITILMPLTLSMLLGVGGFVFINNKKVKKIIMILLFIFIWIVATPIFSFCLLSAWEKKTQPLMTIDPSAQAIVILGGGLFENAPEYGGAVISDFTQARLHYGVSLYKKQNLPILLTGGDPGRIGTSEAAEMNKVLETYYLISAKWVEGGSDNTFFNAKNTAQILKSARVNKVYIITHAWHMPRAALIFKKFGIDVIEAPTRFSDGIQVTALNLLPTADGLARSSLVIKEMIGYLYYSNCDICHP